MDALKYITYDDFRFNVDRYGDPKGVVEISCKTTVDSAFRVLQKHDILAAPVYDDSPQNKYKGERREYLGFFDTFNVIHLLIRIEDAVRSLPNKQFSSENVEKIASNGCPFKKGKTIGGDLSLEDYFKVIGGPLYPWCAVTRNTSMEKVVKLLTKTKRVAVLDKTSGRCELIISRQLLLQTLLENQFDKDNELFNTFPNEEFGLKKVHVARESEAVGMVYRKMVRYDVTASKSWTNLRPFNVVSQVAIVDEKGKLQYCISSRDVHNFFSVQRAAKEIYKFEQRRRLIIGDKVVYSNVGDVEHDGWGAAYVDDANDPLWGRHAVEMVMTARANSPRNKAFSPIVCSTVDSTLGEIIEKMVGVKVHRVFLVDTKGKKPVGVVSGADVIKIIFHLLQK